MTAPDKAGLTDWPDPPADYDYADDMEDCCPNCGGEGVVYSCFEEWACIDPEGGCDLCEQRCDWCRPAGRRALEQGETDA